MSATLEFEADATASFSSVVDSADHVVRMQPASRRWLLIAGIVLTLWWAASQMSRGQAPWSLALLVIWLGAVLRSRIPVVVTNADGIRLQGRRFTPWSQVASIQPAEDNGWMHQLPEAILTDGRRLPIEPLTPQQLQEILQLHRQFQEALTGTADPTTS